VRILLVIVLAAGVAVVSVIPELQALLAGMLVMLVAFLLGAAKLAIDLIDLERTDLIADAVLVATLGIALTQISAGNRLLDVAVIALALAAQVAALAAGRRRLRNA
jgi:hypothetical protein